LAARGVTAVVLWHRPGYSRFLDKARAVVRRKWPSALPSPGPSGAREAAFSRPVVRRGWVWVALLDSCLHYLLRVRWRLARGVVVICDRYVMDGVLDLSIKFPETEVRSWSAVRLFSKLVPKPDVSILLMLSWELMIERMRVKREPFPDSPADRRKRFDAYEEAARSGDFVVIDASQDLDAVHSQVLAAIDRSKVSPRD